MGKHLVLVGGGHAHMMTLANLNQFIQNGHHVTVVGPSDYHYYSGMGPGMLGGTYTPEEIRFSTRHVVEKAGGSFVRDEACRFDPDQKILYLKSGHPLKYDVVSFNCGSSVSRDIIAYDDLDIFTVKPIETLLLAKNRLEMLMQQDKITVAVVGGGPAALEIAGNIWKLYKNTKVFAPHIKVIAGSTFMAGFLPQIRDLAVKSLAYRNIELIEKYVKTIDGKHLILDDNAPLDADFIFLATGVHPSPVFKASGIPVGPDGGLWVNTYLQSPRYKNVFGGGDCIYFEKTPLKKVGVYAVRQNPVLLHNLFAFLENQPLIPFDPGGGYLLIFNTGDDRGILHKGLIRMENRWAFKLKDHIDRKFMKKFQSNI